MSNYNKGFYKYLDKIGTIVLPIIISIPIGIGLYNEAKESRIKNSSYIIQEGLELKVILDNKIITKIKFYETNWQKAPVVVDDKPVSEYLEK